MYRPDANQPPAAKTVTFLFKFIGRSYLPPRRTFNRQLHCRLSNLLTDPIP